MNDLHDLYTVTCEEQDAALATLNKAAEQIYNLEGRQWQEAYETIEAVLNKLTTTTNEN